ncbi:DMT family transporter [Candidatus Leptofilum sp.]|uniref:DMT family transporter n=1 Tax=Candidatus Leptofilum sp. TaxID=3241576 RepID=UPI003B5C7FCA
MAPQQPSSQRQWLTLALIAQLGWGAYPVFLRYLQTVSQIPSLSLLAIGNCLVLLLVLAARWRQIEWRIFRLPLLWLFGSLVVLRGITNLLATRYTLATYAQLIYLMTPFIVALLSRLVLREQLPRHTFKALTLCLLGAVLIMSGNLGTVSSETAVARNDWLGISLAVASSLFLALYMLVTRRTERHHASGESLLLVHLTALTLFSGVTSAIFQEDWGHWCHLQPGDWLVFGLFTIGVLLGANLGQLRSIQRLGAPLVSSMMATRLVSALIVGSLLLNEWLSSGWQMLGAIVVFITLTWYLRQGNGRSSRHIYRQPNGKAST